MFKQEIIFKNGDVMADLVDFGTSCGINLASLQSSALRCFYPPRAHVRF